MTFNIWEFIMQSRRQADLETKMRNRWDTQPCMINIVLMIAGTLMNAGFAEIFLPLWAIIVICHVLLAGSTLHPVVMIYTRLMLYNCLGQVFQNHQPILAISPK